MAHHLQCSPPQLRTNWNVLYITLFAVDYTSGRRPVRAFVRTELGAADCKFDYLPSSWTARAIVVGGLALREQLWEFDLVMALLWTNCERAYHRQAANSMRDDCLFATCRSRNGGSICVDDRLLTIVRSRSRRKSRMSAKLMNRDLRSIGCKIRLTWRAFRLWELCKVRPYRIIHGCNWYCMNIF